MRDDLSDQIAGSSLSVLVLAAGRSERMGAANKLLMPVDGRSLLRRVVENVAAVRPLEVIVVTGHERAQVESELAGCSVRLVHNPEYASGLASSLRAGVRAADPAASGFMVCLADMPFATGETLRRLRRAFDERGPHTIIVPAFEERRGHPVLFDHCHREDLASLSGDAGGRPILAKHSEAVFEVPVEDEGVLIDIDTPEAYQRYAEKAVTPQGATVRRSLAKKDCPPSGTPPWQGESFF